MRQLTFRAGGSTTGQSTPSRDIGCAARECAVSLDVIVIEPGLKRTRSVTGGRLDGRVRFGRRAVRRVKRRCHRDAAYTRDRGQVARDRDRRQRSRSDLKRKQRTRYR